MGRLCVSVARQTEFARIDFQSDSPDATVTFQLQALEAIISGNCTLEEAEAADGSVSGDRDKLRQWFDMHDTFKFWFNIVTP